MKSITPYLFFQGNCREAMEFYQKCFGGELRVMTFGETEGESCPSERKHQVMHAALMTKSLLLMASDDGTGKIKDGNNVQLSVDCEGLDELEKVFSAISNEGRVVQQLHDAFWGAKFGITIDRYGIYWMFSYDLKKK